MDALAGGSCKEGSRGGGWICGRFDPRSDILTFFNAGFSLLAVRKSGLFFVPSLLGFGLVGKSELCCILHQLPILQIPFLCIWFPCPTMTPCGELAGRSGLGWGGAR